MDFLREAVEKLLLKGEWLDAIRYLDIPNPLWPWGVGAFVLLIALEIAVSLKYDKELYQWRDFASSVSMGAGAVFLATFTKIASIALFFVVYDIFNPVVETISSNLTNPLIDISNRINIIGGYTPFGFQWYMFLVCQFCDDFNYYWYHRLSHEVRVLWAAHIVHHSSDNFNLGTAIRNGWVTLFYKPLFWLWLPAIGFHPVMVATCLAIQSFWQFQLHSKFIPYLGFLELFVNTHKQHQAHHSSNIEYLDTNHGGYLNIFDRIFGTHKVLDEENIQIEYGVLHPPNSYNPLVIVSHEYKNIWKDVRESNSLKEAFMYVFGPPGWSPDGSRKTTKQLRECLKREREKTVEHKKPSLAYPLKESNQEVFQKHA